MMQIYIDKTLDNVLPKFRQCAKYLLEVLNFDKDFEKHLNSCKREWNSTMCYRLASLQLIGLRL